jgi:hypothetical protein
LLSAGRKQTEGAEDQKHKEHILNHVTEGTTSRVTSQYVVTTKYCDGLDINRKNNKQKAQSSACEPQSEHNNIKSYDNEAGN